MNTSKRKETRYPRVFNQELVRCQSKHTNHTECFSGLGMKEAQVPCPTQFLPDLLHGSWDWNH